MLLTKKSLYLSLFFWASFFIYSKQIFAASSNGLVNVKFIQKITPEIDSLLANTERILGKNSNHPSQLFNELKKYAQLLNNFREYLATRGASPDSNHYYQVCLEFFPIRDQIKTIQVRIATLKEFMRRVFSEEEIFNLDLASIRDSDSTSIFHLDSALKLDLDLASKLDPAFLNSLSLFASCLCEHFRLYAHTAVIGQWASFAAPTEGLMKASFILEMIPRTDILLANTERILEENLNHPSELFSALKEYAQLLKNFKEYLTTRGGSPDSDHYYQVYLKFFPIRNQIKTIEVLISNPEKFKKYGSLSENMSLDLDLALKLDPAFLNSLSLFALYLCEHFRLHSDNPGIGQWASRLETSGFR
jgi:hypothetical protein